MCSHGSGLFLLEGRVCLTCEGLEGSPWPDWEMLRRPGSSLFLSTVVAVAAAVPHHQPTTSHTLTHQHQGSMLCLLFSLPHYENNYSTNANCSSVCIRVVGHTDSCRVWGRQAWYGRFGGLAAEYSTRSHYLFEPHKPLSSTPTACRDTKTTSQITFHT